MRHAITLAAMLALPGCGALPYQPAAPPPHGQGAAIIVRGPTQVANAQPDADAVVVYAYRGTRLASSLNAVTQAMVEQVERELQRAFPAGDGASKTLALRVDSLLSRHGGEGWRSELVFEARLGGTRTIRHTVPHTGPSLLQGLDGCIAEGVRVLLDDPAVRAYLAE